MKDLAKRGHKLTIMTTDVIKSLNNNPNVTQVDPRSSYEILRSNFYFAEFKHRKKSVSDLSKVFLGLSRAWIEEQLSHPDVKTLIENKDNKEFDLIVFEHLNSLPYLAFGEVYIILWLFWFLLVRFWISLRQKCFPLKLMLKK